MPGESEKLAYIIGCGTPSFGVLRHIKAQSEKPLIICADGGANYARHVELIPDVIIGDNDSISEETALWAHAHGVSFERFPKDKDKTDLELALAVSIKRGVESISLTSVLGERLDHTLSNISILNQKDFLQLDAKIYEDNLVASFLREGTRILKGNPGETFSLIPYSESVIVSIEGAKWNLSEAEISLGSTKTISNEFVNNSVEITIKKGVVLLIFFFS